MSEIPLNTDFPQTAFVCGATGYTGRAVVAELRKRGIPVVAHIRRDSTRLAEFTKKCAEIGAEVDTTDWDQSAFDATFARLKPTLVFSLLGITRAGAKAEKRRTGKEPSYQTVDYGLTMIAANAAAKLQPAPRFVYLSSLGTADSTNNEYLKWRARAEREIRALKVPFVIARPSFISGENREESRPAERIAATIADTALQIVGAFGAERLRDRFHSMNNEQLARALVGASLRDASLNSVIESDELVRLSEAR